MNVNFVQMNNVTPFSNSVNDGSQNPDHFAFNSVGQSSITPSIQKSSFNSIEDAVFSNGFAGIKKN